MAYTWNQGISSDTKITAAGIIELRNNVNTERTRRAKGAYSFSAEIVSGNKILRSAIEEIRTAVIGIRTDGGYVPPVLPNVDSFLVNNWVSSMRNDLNTLNDTGQSSNLVTGPWLYDPTITKWTSIMYNISGICWYLKWSTYNSGSSCVGYIDANYNFNLHNPDSSAGSPSYTNLTTQVITTNVLWYERGTLRTSPSETFDRNRVYEIRKIERLYFWP